MDANPYEMDDNLHRATSGTVTRRAQMNTLIIFSLLLLC